MRIIRPWRPSRFFYHYKYRKTKRRNAHFLQCLLSQSFVFISVATSLVLLIYSRLRISHQHYDQIIIEEEREYHNHRDYRHGRGFSSFLVDEKVKRINGQLNSYEENDKKNSTLEDWNRNNGLLLPVRQKDSSHQYYTYYHQDAAASHNSSRASTSGNDSSGASTAITREEDQPRNETIQEGPIDTTSRYDHGNHENDIQVTKIQGIPWLEMKTVQYISHHHQHEYHPIDHHVVQHKDNILLLPDNYDHNTFVRYDKVVIVTKVHWAESMAPLKRMLCSIKAAYNRFVNYDILVFTTIPWTDGQIRELGRVVSPARLTVALDGPSLEEQLKELSKDELDFLLQRCHATTSPHQGNGDGHMDPLTWFHHCREENYGTPANLAYSWQSEFRAYHIWKHPALEKYKWMIWMDSDAICTKTWEKDPMKYMVEHNLTVMYDNFPAGSTKGLDLKQKMMRGYGYAICGIWETKDGTWFTRKCREVDVAWVTQIHGFFHITNLDVYRSPKHLTFLKILVGDYRFSRKWDDQLAVTIPAAYEAPERVWDMRKHNMTWNIRHNGEYDGKDKFKVKNPVAWWKSEGRGNWTAGRILCDECFDFKG